MNVVGVVAACPQRFARSNGYGESDRVLRTFDLPETFERSLAAQDGLMDDPAIHNCRLNNCHTRLSGMRRAAVAHDDHLSLEFLCLPPLFLNDGSL